MYKNNIFKWLKETVSKYPDKTAFIQGEQSVTWKEFYDNSVKIATQIIEAERKKDITGNVPIVIYMNKSIVALQSIMGVILSGGSYTPVDVKMPQERVLTIEKQLIPVFVMTDEDNIERANRYFNTEQLIVSEKMLATTELLSKQEEDIEEIARSTIDTDILYTFFTSGSTGVPKGVIITHRAVIDFIQSAIETLDITENEIIGNQGDFHFDLSTLDIYCAIATGATVHLIPKQFFKFPIKLVDYIAENNINFIYWVPSALVLVANMEMLGEANIECLKKVTFCGEVMPCKQLNYWRRYLPESTFVNMYGPTETTCASTFYFVEKDFADDDILPIGKPFANTRIYILDEELKPVHNGEIGEICISGSSLSEGYLNDENKNKNSFCYLDEGNIKRKIYRTGDLAKIDCNGNIIYISRKDFQIKHMGHRIELGEIENAINVLSSGKENCCVYDSNCNQIVAFVEKGLDIELLKRKLKDIIPSYMIPGKYVELDAIPHNVNGKVDRAALKGKLE